MIDKFFIHTFQTQFLCLIGQCKLYPLLKKLEYWSYVYCNHHVNSIALYPDVQEVNYSCDMNSRQIDKHNSRQIGDRDDAQEMTAF